LKEIGRKGKNKEGEKCFTRMVIIVRGSGSMTK